MRIAFVIIATNDQPWRRILKDGQEATWIQQLNHEETYLAAYSDGSLGNSSPDLRDHQKIIFPFRGNKSWDISPPSFMSKNHANFQAHSGYGGLIPTTISAVKYLLDNFNPDYIIRTNVSSYWNMHALRIRLAGLPSSQLYGGVSGAAYGGLTAKLTNARYVSGAGMILSKDVAESLVDSAHKFDIEYIDDLSIGRTFSRVGIRNTELTRVDVRHRSQILNLSPSEIQNAYHFRCKSEFRYGPKTLRRDVSLMKSIHKRVLAYS